MTRTLATSPPPARHRRAFISRLLRRRYPVGAPAPCSHGLPLRADQHHPGYARCVVRGERYLAA